MDEDRLERSIRYPHWDKAKTAFHLDVHHFHTKDSAEKIRESISNETPYDGLIADTQRANSVFIADYNAEIHGLSPARRRETLVNTAIMLYHAHQATSLDLCLARITTLDMNLDDEVQAELEPVTYESIAAQFESWKPNRLKRIRHKLGRLARKTGL